MEDKDFHYNDSQAIIFVISGPSGAGKDSVVKGMVESGLPFYFVVTAASRSPREGEVEGVDYHFVTKSHFEEMIRNDELIEWAHVYGEYKGVPRQQVVDALSSGKDVVMRLDVQGAASVRKLFPRAVLIFLTAEGLTEAVDRLVQRSSESEEAFRIRLETAEKEYCCVTDFDYVVVNERGKLDKTVETVLAIVKAEHHRVDRQKEFA